MSRMIKRLLSTVLAVCVLMSVTALMPTNAYADDAPIKKVLCQTSYMPVALMDVSYIYATTSTDNATVESLAWYDASGTPASGQFGEGQYRMEIRVDANDGYYFTEDVTAYINNEAATVSRSGDGKYVVLTRTVDAMVWAPTVVKQPTGEELDAGGYASFNSTAMYTTGCYWTVVSPDGNETLKADEVTAAFPGTTTSGDGTERFVLHDIPADMDGWAVRCNFKGAGGYETKSNKALLTVHGEKTTAAAAATPTPAPSQTPTPSPTLTPEPGPTPTPATEEHIYGDTWEKDEYNHWKVCEKCGGPSEKEEHDFIWTEPDQDGKMTGTCSVCGYQVTETEKSNSANATASSAANDKTDVVNFVFIGLIAAALIALVVEIVISVKSKKKHHRKKKSRR